MSYLFWDIFFVTLFFFLNFLFDTLHAIGMSTGFFSHNWGWNTSDLQTISCSLALVSRVSWKLAKERLFFAAMLCSSFSTNTEQNGQNLPHFLHLKLEEDNEDVEEEEKSIQHPNQPTNEWKSNSNQKMNLNANKKKNQRHFSSSKLRRVL